MALTFDPSTDEPRGRLPALVAVLEEGLGKLHTGVQVYISQQGRPIADFGLGESRPGVAMTPNLIVPWLSAGKPVTAVAVLRECERGNVPLDAPIAEFIPEFAGGGKHDITLRHVLTHTAGFRSVDIGWPDVDWDESVRRVCAAEIEPDWIPGERAGYHVASSWVVLGELLSRWQHRSVIETLRSSIFDPLAMSRSHCGMSPETWRTIEEQIGGLYQREKGALQLSEWHTEKWCAAISPGGNCRGPVRELGWFYESLLGLRGPALLGAAMLADFSARQRVGMFDETLQHTVDFGLGVIVDSNRYGRDTVPYGFGPFCSEQTFGHGGSQCSIGFADPAHGFVICWAANGRPGEPQHQRRNRAINEAIYRDLGLARA
jgi:CubicO group peptidase (beta-lactamase class C family)